MKRLIIDRFEGSYAICEEEPKTLIKIPKYKLPLGSKEGDLLVQDADGMFQLSVETVKEQKRIRDRMTRLFSNAKTPS